MTTDEVTCDGSAVCLANERDHFSYCRSQMTWADLDRLEAAEAAAAPEDDDPNHVAARDGSMW